MSMAVASPWPPQRNGIADYTYELALHTHAPITIVTDAQSPRAAGPLVRLTHVSQWRSSALRYLPSLYHFGNNPDHVSHVLNFLDTPGVALVHDVSLHYLAELVDRQLPGFFEAQLRLAFPPDVVALMHDTWRQPGHKRSLDYQEVPQLQWLAQARRIIVHSHFAARVVRGFLPSVRVQVVPHFAYQPRPGDARAAAALRGRIGANDDTLVVTLPGFATRNKLYPAVLRAVATLPAALRRRIILLLAGEVPSDGDDLVGLASRLDCTDNLRMLGYVDEGTLNAALGAADLVLNLRHPSFGESSGSVARAFGYGRLVAVSDSGAYSELPEDCCVKLPAGPDPSRDVALLLERLAEAPSELAPRAAAAQSLARGALHPATIAGTLADAVAAAHA